MKKKTLATVISIISFLFIFSSISYAATSTEWVNAHNSRRYLHGAPIVTWDPALAAQAKTEADNWNGVHPHPGQNYSGSKGSAESIVSDWYSEEPAYVQYVGYGNEPKTKIVNGWTWLDDPNFGKYGHFTQVVWKGSTKIGCATGTGGTICNYLPYGNTAGQFKQNVGYNYLRLFKLIYPSLFPKFYMIMHGLYPSLVTQVYPIKW